MKVIPATINGITGKLILENRFNESCIGCILCGKEFCMLDTPEFININGKTIKCEDCRSIFRSDIVIGMCYNEISPLSDVSYKMINNEFCKDRCVYKDIRNESNEDIISCRTYWGYRDKCPMRFMLDRITGNIEE